MKRTKTTSAPEHNTHSGISSELRGLPTPQAQRRISLLILCFLAFQLIRPAIYYFGSSRFDERFSWRFFSSVSLQQHDFSLRETQSNGHHDADKNLSLPQLLKLGAIKKLLNTRHPDIIVRFLQWRFAHSRVLEVRYQGTSVTTDGQPLPTVRMWIDSDGRIHDQQAGP